MCRRADADVVSIARSRPAFHRSPTGWQDHFTLRFRIGIESLDDEIGPIDAAHGVRRTPQDADEGAVADLARMLGQREMVLDGVGRALYTHGTPHYAREAGPDGGIGRRSGLVWVPGEETLR